MSKNIWHRYDEAPKHKDIIMTDTGCWAYKADLFALEAELERTRKALDRAKLILKNLLPDLNGYERLDVEKALAEITALEQKDYK